MNWLAHLFLSQPKFEDRLGNILPDLVKGKNRYNLSPCFDRGIKCHLLVDSFTDRHSIVKRSKKRIIPQHTKYSGILVDVFYDYFLAKNWDHYSQVSLSIFNKEVYESFANNLDKIPATKRIKHMIDEDLLGSYYYLSGIEKALTRIKKRLSPKHSNNFIVDRAIRQLEESCDDFNEDFNIFFPELIEYVKCQKN